jgi:hypothetical protein
MRSKYLPFIPANPHLGNPAMLRRLVDENGYLFVRDYGPKQKILDLRRQILELCRDAGWLDPGADLMEGRWSGVGPYGEGQPEYMAVYKHILKLPAFDALPADPALMKLVGSLFDGEVLLHRLHIGRITFPNNVAQSTAAHQDFTYIKGTTQTYTIWMPIGDCPRELGGLAALAGSHRLGLLEHKEFPGRTYAKKGIHDESFESHGLDWHTDDFKLGDLLLFHSHTIHEALPNVTPNRLRLSCDNRYQQAGDTIHEPVAMRSHYGLAEPTT